MNQVDQKIRLLILDNRDSFSQNLRHLFLQFDNVSVTVRPTSEFTSDIITSYQSIILSPGPGLPDDHEKLLYAIEEAENIVPVLGVCLGLQAIVSYFGGQLGRLSKVQHGIQSKLVIQDSGGLWNGIDEALVGRYHSYVAVEKDWPDELRVTAVDSEGQIMALQHVKQPFYAVQFHPESYMTSCGNELANNYLNIIRNYFKR